MFDSIMSLFLHKTFVDFTVNSTNEMTIIINRIITYISLFNIYESVKVIGTFLLLSSYWLYHIERNAIPLFCHFVINGSGATQNFISFHSFSNIQWIDSWIIILKQKTPIESLSMSFSCGIIHVQHHSFIRLFVVLRISL